MEGGRDKWQSAEQPKGQRCRWEIAGLGEIEAKLAGQENYKVLAYLQSCPGLRTAVEATETAVAKQWGHMLFCLMTASLSNGNLYPDCHCKSRTTCGTL